jgi:hypothetical protein
MVGIAVAVGDTRGRGGLSLGEGVDIGFIEEKI